MSKARRINFNVLLISAESWSGHWVSKHHYAKALVDAGISVYFLEPPTLGSKKFTVQEAKDVLGVHVLSCRRVFPALQYIPGIFRRLIERRWLNSLERFLDINFDVVWLFENSRFFDMRFAAHRLKIYHQVDLNQNFHPLTAAKTADIVLCTSDVIANNLAKSGKKIHKIHHGVTLHQGNPQTLSESSKIKNSDINAAYVGNLDIDYLDLPLLEEAVSMHPEIVFHLVGGYCSEGETYSALKKYQNVRWWGQVNPAAVASILHTIDISLLIYKAETYRDQLSGPHKVMEYFAAGAVCVATYTDEYKDRPELLQMAERREDYLLLLAEVVKSLEVYNSPDAVKCRQAFAGSHTYSKQLQRIVAIIENAGFKMPILRARDE